VVVSRVSQTARLTVIASGDLPLRFQWTRDGVPIEDDERITGTTSSTLEVRDVMESDFGAYQATVSNPCSTLLPISVLLTPWCPADFNHNGEVNAEDFLEFLAAFLAGLPSADFNADSVVDSRDFFEFLLAYFGACQ
jgi:hypothetical protein